ncbi:MAG: glycosyltransferase [Gammaproteobacteria bacterium]|nr:glycosyltransferase [Gammaproteobacteria bacterium]
MSQFCIVSDQERSELKKKLGIEFAHVVLFVGRLSEEKNISGLLRAWRLACSSLATEWGLVLVGGGRSELNWRQ